MRVKLPIAKTGGIRYSGARCFCSNPLADFLTYESSSRLKFYRLAYDINHPDFKVAERCLHYVEDREYVPLIRKEEDDV